MPTFTVDRLTEVSRVIFEAAGASSEEAAIVTRHLVEANLAGHDSHGMIRIPKYVARMESQQIVPNAPFEVVRESPSSLVIDGNWGFGYTVTERTMRMAIDKAKTNGVAAATIRQQGHIGRLAAYTLMAAKEGMIAFLFADSGRGPKQVVPYGGREPRLGTNPLSFAAPSNLAGPLFLDMATSAVAGGKISLALARGEKIPTGWVIDADGNQTTDPSHHKNGGFLLPLGGTEGYKGYGLAVMVEILCGLLPGLGFGFTPKGKHNDGVFLAVFNVDAFRPLATFKQEVSEFATYLGETPPAAGFKRVYYPGEIEHMTEIERNRDGIKIEDKTWAKISETAQKYGVAGRLGLDKAA